MTSVSSDQCFVIIRLKGVDLNSSLCYITRAYIKNLGACLISDSHFCTFAEVAA